jgi:hypothetical protein
VGPAPPISTEMPAFRAAHAARCVHSPEEKMTVWP